jgi:hypothetical protein
LIHNLENMNGYIRIKWELEEGSFIYKKKN